MAERFDNPEAWSSPVLEPRVVYAHDLKQAAKHEQAGYMKGNHVERDYMQTLYKADHSAPPRQFKQSELPAALEEGWQEKPVAYQPPVINMTEDRKFEAVSEENKQLREEMNDLKAMMRQLMGQSPAIEEETAHRGPGRPRKVG